MSCAEADLELLLAIFAAWAALLLLLAIVVALSIIERRREIKRIYQDRRSSRDIHDIRTSR